VQMVTETASPHRLPWLTLYAFHWKTALSGARRNQLSDRLLKSYLESNLQRMMDNNVRIAVHRAHADLPHEVQEKMRWVEETTARNTGTTLTLALNYGGVRNWWTHFRGLAAEMKRGRSAPTASPEEDIHRHLYTAKMPDPDLLIRTSGEQRISNFLLWQIAYTEIFVTSATGPTSVGFTCWSYRQLQLRERRYGGSAKTAAKWKKIPSRLGLRRTERAAARSVSRRRSSISPRGTTLPISFRNRAVLVCQCILIP